MSDVFEVSDSRACPVSQQEAPAQSIDPHEIRQALDGLRELIASIHSQPINRDLERAYDRISRIQVVEY